MKARTLLSSRPDLVAQLHPTKNGHIDLGTVGFGSNKVVWWLCEKGHVYDSKITDKSYNGYGCPICSHQRITLENCFAVFYPHLVDEWDVESNLPLTPYNVAPKTTKVVYWKCKQGHGLYPCRISHRADGHGCPKCNNQDSKLQLYFYSELKYYFDDIKYKYKVDGHECDIYIPQYKIGIEVDGHHWHKDKTEQDKKKVDELQSEGITIINIREKGLAEVSLYTVRFTKKQDRFIVSKDLMLVLYKLTNDNRLLLYQDLKSPINEAYYLTQVSNYPAPPLENSLDKVNPKLASEWDYDNNGNLKPSDVCPNANHKVYWKCAYGHSWIASIDNRNNKGHGCPQCWAIRRKSKTVKT